MSHAIWGVIQLKVRKYSLLGKINKRWVSLFMDEVPVGQPLDSGGLIGNRRSSEPADGINLSLLGNHLKARDFDRGIRVG